MVKIAQEDKNSEKIEKTEASIANKKNWEEINKIVIVPLNL